jgi:YHS domain-containing protein
MKLSSFIVSFVAIGLAACQASSVEAESDRLAASPPSAALPLSAAPPMSAAPPPSDGRRLTNGLVRVEPSNVCMVNNQDMGKPQIPVIVDGKTYFGCCAMCKGRLEKDAAARTAVDPVTSKPVDKATAVIARNESGDIMYFASEETLRRYRP